MAAPTSTDGGSWLEIAKVVALYIPMLIGIGTFLKQNKATVKAKVADHLIDYRRERLSYLAEISTLLVQLSEASERTKESMAAIDKEVHELINMGMQPEDMTEEQIQATEPHKKNLDVIRELIVKARIAAEKYGALPGESPKYLGDELSRWLDEFREAINNSRSEKTASQILFDGLQDIRSLAEIERNDLLDVAQNAKNRPYVVVKTDGSYQRNSGELMVALQRELRKRKQP